MNIKEINDMAWNVSDSLEVREFDEGSIGLTEQELHIISLREPNTIEVCCSSQTGITQLSKSEYFTVDKVLVSIKKNFEGFILQVDGTLENKGLTIRKKKPQFTEEEKKRRSDFAKNRFNKDKSNVRTDDLQ